MGELRGVSAGTVEAKAYTTGNYNGMMAKSLTGVTCRIFSLPSIITNDSSVTDLQQLVTEQRLVYRSYKNLPSSLKESKFKNDGGFAFVPNQLVSYSDTGSCAKITENTTSGTSARVTLLKGLQDSYSGTIVQSDPEIKRVVDVVIDENNPSNEVVNLAGNLVNNSLGGNIEVRGNISLGSSNGGSLLCEDLMTEQNINHLNTLWLNGDIDIYGDLNFQVRYYTSDYLSGFSKTQWCNNVKNINISSSATLTTDLVNAFNSITNLYSVKFLGNVSSNASILSNLNNYMYFKSRGCGIVPSEIWSFNKIKGIYISGCGLQVPTSIGNLTNLEHLELDGNNLSLITNEFGNLTKLKTLSISNNGLNSLPSGIDNLTMLTSLNISSNNFTTLPSGIGNLINLTYLNLNSCNNLTTIPSEIGNLVNLNELFIDSTLISNLPTTIGNLSNLNYLSISYNNSLSSLPNEIGNLSNLQTLNSINNPNLTSIPSSVGNLINITHLYLSDNNLSSLPSQLSNLNSLEYLGLYGNTSLGNLSTNFFLDTSPLTQGGMTIQGNGTNIVVTGTF